VNLHALRDGGSVWNGAKRIGIRETDPALARAEQWQYA
jgi:hypothetical protein